MKFIHGADLHLDRAFEGLSDLPAGLSNQLGQENQEMLNKIVQQAIIEEVDFILLVGDTFHQPTVSIATQKIVIQAFRELAKKGISVIITFGNHDYYNSETYWFEFPENVFIFKSEEVETIQLRTKDQEQVAISGFSYEHRWLENSKLSDYPTKKQQVDYHIGLYHGTLGSENLTQNYAPFSLSEMTSKGYDYWALGHIHQPQVLKTRPPIIYSGSPIGHSKKETNSQGVVLVETQGSQLTYQWLNLGGVQWQDLTLVCQGLTSRKELLHSIENRLFAFKEAGNEELSLIALELSEVSESLRNQITSELANGGLLNYLQERVFEESQGKLWLRSLAVVKNTSENPVLPLGVTARMLAEISQKISRDRFNKITEELTRQGSIAYLLPKDEPTFQSERISSSLAHVLSELSQAGGGGIMRLVRLTMINFGKWQNKTIDFQKGLTLIYGDNEAGKTTLHHFIKTMLFGFPKKRKNFRDYEPRQGGLFGGSLTIEVPNYGQITIERYKSVNRGKAQVTLADGREITEAELMALLEPLTPELFSEVFSLQQEQLRELKYLTEEKLQELLLAVGMTGSNQMMTAKAQLNKEEQGLYKPTGRVPLINQKLKEYEAAHSQVLQKTQIERQYQQQLQELESQEQVLKKAQVKLSTLKGEEQLIEQQITAFPLWQEQQHLQKQLTKEEFPKIEEVTKLYQDYQFVKKEEENYSIKQKNELAHSQATPAYLFYLENQVRIEKLTSKQRRMEQNAQQIKWLENRVSLGESESQQLLAGLPALDFQGRYFPELLEQEKLKSLAQREEGWGFRLQQQESHFDQVLSEIEEEAENTMKDTELPQSRKGGLLSSSAVVLMLIGLSLLFLKLFLVAGLSLLASVVLLFLKYKGQQKQVHLDKVTGLSQKEQNLEQIAEEIEKIQGELKSLQEHKQAVATSYQFNMEQTVSQWLLELPQRGQLVRLTEELASLKGELTKLQWELTSYRQAFSFMKEWLPIGTSSDEELLAALTNFVAEMSQRSLTLNQTGQSLTTWQEPLRELASRRETLTAHLYSFLPEGVTQSMENVQRLLFENQQRSQQAAELVKISLQVDQLFTEEQDYQLARLVTRKEALKVEIPNLIHKQQELSGGIEKLRFLIQQQESDGTLRELYQKEANLETELRELINQWYDNRLGDEILQDTLDQLATSQLPVLLATTTAFLKLLTAERFVEVTYEEDELLLKDQQGLDYAVKELSTGSRDQLYMAIRLGFIKLHSQESLSPVIIDDGWLHYDSQRKQQLFRLLKQLSRDNQIICLSSDSEVLAFMEAEDEGIIVL